MKISLGSVDAKGHIHAAENEGVIGSDIGVSPVVGIF